MRLRPAVSALLGGLALAGCGGGGGPHVSPVIPGNVGDPGRGREVAAEVGCASCHRIPGVDGDALVGPPLDAWGRRSFIAGSLHNDPANLALWLTDPQAVEPGTAMPDLDLAPSQVDDLVAYLFSLD